MGILTSTETLEVHECDRCDVVFEETIDDCPAFKYRQALQHGIFKGRTLPLEHNKSLCLDCLKAVTPLFSKLRDIDETIIYVNYILRSIYAVRNKDYWPNANDAGKGGIERLRRNIRDRASISAPQALEEHH